MLMFGKSSGSKRTSWKAYAALIRQMMPIRSSRAGGSGCQGMLCQGHFRTLTESDASGGVRDGGGVKAGGG
eukprot:scaffold3696_cov188-Prasinococcus_capsulatus_cf.AAC.1